jgi:hypothetical protein
MFLILTGSVAAYFHFALQCVGFARAKSLYFATRARPASEFDAFSHIAKRTKGNSLMTTCERCNTENLDGSQYCDECGAPLGVPSVRAKKGDGAPASAVVAQENKSAPKEAQPAMSTPPQPTPPSPPAAAAVAKKSEAPNGQQASASFAISSGSISMMDGAHAKLVIERGRSAGKQFPLSDDESQIGRWDADGGIFPDVDLDADDPEAKVSRRHARIMRRNGQYYIEDLGSTNGTFINRGRRLLPGDRQPLRDGDEIIVGKTFLRFHVVK